MQIVGSIERRGVNVLQLVKSDRQIIALNIIGVPILVRSVIISLQEGESLNFLINDKSFNANISKYKGVRNLAYFKSQVTVDRQKQMNAFIYVPMVKVDPDNEKGYIISNNNADAIHQFQTHLMAHSLLPFSTAQLPKIWEMGVKLGKIVGLPDCYGFDNAWQLSFKEDWDAIIVKVVENG